MIATFSTLAMVYHHAACDGPLQSFCPTAFVILGAKALVMQQDKCAHKRM